MKKLVQILITSVFLLGMAFGQFNTGFAQDGSERTYNPDDIAAPDGVKVALLASGLNYPVDMTFGDNGEMYVAEAGDHTYGTVPEKSPPSRIVQVMPDGSKRVIYDHYVPWEDIRKYDSSADMPEGIIPPVTGVTYFKGKLYVTHRTRVSILDPKTGDFHTIVNGMPSWGFFQNNKVIIGPHQNKIYFFLSSQGNAGPIDEHWMKVINIFNKPNAHEVPCQDVTLTGKDYPVPVEDPSTPSVGDTKMTGVYVPLGERTHEGEVIPGELMCNTAFFSANLDGSDLKMISWGFRSNFGYRFSPDGVDFVTTENSGNPIPPRAIHNDYETVYEVHKDKWYGWPDYYSGIPITDPLFDFPNVDRSFVLTEDTHQKLLGGDEKPIQPLAYLQPHTAIEGMVYGNKAFGIPENQVLVAEFGTIVTHLRDESIGFRVQRVDLDTGEVFDFLTNKVKHPASVVNTGGMERPIQLEWGPDNALYVVDFGIIALTEQGMMAHANTGAIWKVTSNGNPMLEKHVQPEMPNVPDGANIVKVELQEYEIDMPNRMPTGTTVFEVKNIGRIDHNFEIMGQGIDQKFDTSLWPGETMWLQVDLSEGKYTVIDPLYDHVERDMRLTIRAQ